jgi:tetratricopeptide (TPR) repeat protein
MRQSLKHLLLIAFVGLAAYSNSFHVPFQFDDYANISENPVLRRLGNFVSSAQGYHYNPRRFIGNLTFALNYSLGGLNVVGYHLVNIAIHITTAFLLYVFVMLTFWTPYFRGYWGEATDNCNGGTAPGAEPENRETHTREDEREAGGRQYAGSRFRAHDSGSLIALFSALLFVAHPVQTEAVTYIVQRLTSLAAMFYLLSIVLYVQGRLVVERANGSGQGVTAGKPSARPMAGNLQAVVFFALSFLSSVLAMMTKEIAFKLPIMVIMYEFTFFKTSLRKKLLFLLPVVFTIVIIPLSILGVHKPLGEIISDLSMKTRVQTSIPRWDYLITQLKVVTAYIRILFFPVNQNLDYGYPAAHSLLEVPVLLSLLFLLAVFAAAAYLLCRSGQEGKPAGPEADAPFTIYSSRLIAFGILWFFVALAVESSVIPIVDVMFEHRVYLPSAGAFIAITSATYVGLAHTLKDKRAVERGFTLFFSVVVAILCVVTFARNTVWLSELSLWEDVAKKSPGNARAYNNIGYFFLGQGRPDAALGYFRKAIDLSPGYADAQDNAGVALYEEGRYDWAAGQFMRAVSLMPDVSDFHHNLGLAYVQKGLLDDALAEFGTSLRLSPNNYEIYNDMGVIYRRQGHIAEAIESFQRAVELNPDYAGAHYNLGLAYQSIGLQEKAAGHLGRAHLLDPGRF